MESCLYEGFVHHERRLPVKHRFRNALYMVLLDLAEVPGLIRTGVLSAGRFAPGSFLRRDHFGNPRQPLEESVRDLIQQETGSAANGPIRLLTHLRTFGTYFSPLNLFFCYEGDAHIPKAIVAEVQNTPWLERHCYVLWAGNNEGAWGNHRHRKAFHVSPFMDMDMEYRWQLSSPGETLDVGIGNTVENNLLFQAVLKMRRISLSRRSLLAMQCRYPLMTARITAAIYFQAFQLWRKKCPYYPHPKRRTEKAILPKSSNPPTQGLSTVSAGPS
jgi:DUF1365 family protein